MHISVICVGALVPTSLENFIFLGIASGSVCVTERLFVCVCVCVCVDASDSSKYGALLIAVLHVSHT